MKISKCSAVVVIVAILSISSCRKSHSTSQNNAAEQKSTVAHVEPERVLSKDERSCQEFVQKFYDWYVSREVLDAKVREGHPSSDDVVRLRPQVLSPELRELLKEDSVAQAKAEDIVGLEADPFFDSQDPSPKFLVESVSVKDGRCNAVVNGFEEGKKQERVMPELISSGPTWVFVNFHYVSKFPQDENLITMLKMLRDQRNKPRK
jgi:hypothetical protein